MLRVISPHGEPWWRHLFIPILIGAACGRVSCEVLFAVLEFDLPPLAIAALWVVIAVGCWVLMLRVLIPMIVN